MTQLIKVKETRALIAQAADEQAAPAERQEAFGEVVVRFQDMAYGCAWAVLRDFALAEEAAQEAFITAWQRLDQLREPEAFPGWFRRIVLTACNRLARGKRLTFVPLEAGYDLPSAAADPSVSAERRELAEKVHAAIRALPEHERLVATLFYIGEYSQAEIGLFLELPVTTVVKRLYSARRRLKERMIEMFRDDLQIQRPSRDQAFADEVSARLRPFNLQEWGLISSFVYGLEPDFRQDDEAWLRNRQQFDEARYRRRQYVAEYAGTVRAPGQMIGYGAIEQTIFLPRYRLFLAVEPNGLRGGVGDLLLDRLLDDLREAGAIKVWHRNYAQRTEVLDFLTARGFVETARVWDLRLDVARADTMPFLPLIERLAARGITITTFAAERERDAASLHKLHEFLNAVKADDPQRQPFTPAPFESVVRWFERRDVLPDACFIAKRGGEYIGFTDLNHIHSIAGPIPRGIMHGFTGVAREDRRQGVATALKVRAIEYARAHSYQTVRAFNSPAQAGALAFNENLGFSRHYCYVTVEKFVREPMRVDTQIYDDYVGQYAPAAAALAQYGAPTGLTITIRKAADRLFSEARDMRDELFPASETDFFTDHHYGQATFVGDESGRVTHLLYREGEMTLRADKIN